MGPPVNKGPEARDVRAGHLDDERNEAFLGLQQSPGWRPPEKSWCEIRGGTGRKELGIA